jgi:hypothetical protein
MLEAKYLCQELTIRGSPTTSVLWAGDSIITRTGIWRMVHHFAIHYRSAELAIALERGDGHPRLRADPILAHVCNIAVGEQGLFFVVDLSIGSSLSFRIEYRQRGEVAFAQAARIEWEGIPKTVVSGVDAVGSTFCWQCLTIWNV